jgi:quinol monooxygenase YgiN
MSENVNVIDWHIHLLRVDRWLKIWSPAVERALAYGAASATLSRSEEDPHHFRQVTTWEDRGDFDRYWQGEELTAMRQEASGLYNVPVLPHWERLVIDAGAAQPAEA